MAACSPASRPLPPPSALRTGSLYRGSQRAARDGDFREAAAADRILSMLEAKGSPVAGSVATRVSLALMDPVPELGGWRGPSRSRPAVPLISTLTGEPQETRSYAGLLGPTFATVRFADALETSFDSG